MDDKINVLLTVQIKDIDGNLSVKQVEEIINKALTPIGATLIVTKFHRQLKKDELIEEEEIVF